MKTKINIFLDSNALYGDPLFKTSFGKLLIQLSKNNKIELFLSRVVYQESANNYEKCISKNIETLSQVDNELKKLLNNSPKLPKLKTKQLLYQFDTFYNENIKNNTFSIIEYEDSYLKELIERSIKRKFLFTEHRQEFRDATIWISYVNHINKSNLTNNFFITNNKKDFWNSDKNDLHAELRKEIKDLKVYSSIPEFCSKEKALLKIKGEKDFSEWIRKNPINKEIIIMLLLTEYWQLIKNKVLNSIDTSSPGKYFDDDRYVYFEYQYSKENVGIDSLDTREITDFVFVSCNLTIDGFGLFYPKENVWFKEKNDIQFILKMTFNLYEKFKLRDIKIENVKLNYTQ